MINAVNNIKYYSYQPKISAQPNYNGVVFPPAGNIFVNDTYNTQLPNGNRNYVMVDPVKVNYFVKQGENALPYLSEVLAYSNDEVQITETLYILNSMFDSGTKGIDKLYPVLSRFNNTTSPNVQTFLAGIYRKTQVPDAFGPLIKMLIQNSLHPQNANFDPNEEIGGAILSYINPHFRN